jgi:hypothetical protein
MSSTVTFTPVAVPLTVDQLRKQLLIDDGMELNINLNGAEFKITAADWNQLITQESK